MPWTFVRPADPSLLSARPLLDIGTGDAQTIRGLGADHGMVVGIDRSFEVLRTAALPHRVCADAFALPARDASIATVLAADLFHHVEDLRPLLAEVARVLSGGGRLVAWWYATPATPAPDAPRFTRRVDEVIDAVRDAGFGSIEALELVVGVEGGPQTVGLTAVRRR